VTERGDGARLTAAGAARLAREALSGGEPLVLATVVEAPPGGPSAPPRPGDRLCVRADGRRTGSLGDAALDAAVEAAARALLADEGRPGTVRVGDGERSCTVYLEPHRPPPSLVIVGAGHIARPLCRIGAMLGFRVTVLDDRPEFATRERFPEAAEVRRADFADPLRGVRTGPGTSLVLVTRGHKYDFEALRGLLLRDERPGYVGMVGSRRRTRAALEMLVREGIPPERLAGVHAPIGLDVGAETPEEIAVAIAAELVLVRRGGTGRPLRDAERVFQRWIERDALPDDPLETPKPERA
jgi:xanthine dehydrogenase accessory factor